jgi:hypothetical protein
MIHSLESPGVPRFVVEPSSTFQWSFVISAWEWKRVTSKLRRIRSGLLSGHSFAGPAHEENMLCKYEGSASNQIA